MENHPIPQDVTGFKFRLIGSVTLKQFLYLLGAGGVCLILYVLPLPVFVKFPLMGIPIIISLCLAFVPIDGRPMDKMIMNFAKALPSENEYIFKKIGVEMPFFNFNPPTHAATAHISDQRTTQKAVLFNQLSRSYFNPDKDEIEGMETISALFQNGNAPAQGFVNRVVKADEAPTGGPASPNTSSLGGPTKTTAVPLPERGMEEGLLAKPEEPVHIQNDLIKPAPLPQIVPEENMAPVQPTPVAVPTPQPAPVVAPVSAAVPVSTPAPTSTTPAAGVSTAPQASYESPNVIEGIVRDARGKPLPHIIVEVISSTGIPVRTFRTAANGMFISATPIPNGLYTLHMEDTLKKQDFTDREIQATGKALPVIEITSTDQREKLRRELFGGTA